METSAPYGNPFGPTLAPLHDAPASSTFASAAPSSETPLFQPPSHDLGVPHSAINVQPVSVTGSSLMAVSMSTPCGGTGMVQSGYPSSLLLGTGVAQSSSLGGNNPQAGGGVLLGSMLDEAINKNNNPFLF